MVGIRSEQTKRAVPAFVPELEIRKEYTLARNQINARSARTNHLSRSMSCWRMKVKGPNNCPSKVGTVAGFAAVTNLHKRMSREGARPSAI